MKAVKIVLLIFGLLCIGVSILTYRVVYAPNVALKEKYAFVYIPTGYNAKQVGNLLLEKGFLKNLNSFEILSKLKNYAGKQVVPGKYKIEDGMNNHHLINSLRAGRNRLDVKVIINNARTKEELAGIVGSFIEADSLAIIKKLNDKDYVSKFGLDTTTILSLFLPNTYNFLWNTSPEEFIERMAEEYQKFWNEERLAKAEELNMKPIEVSILASIVQAEQRNKPDERPKIAGLYLNRLRKRMLLQSDPTVIYGLRDFTIKRVLNKHLDHRSPYNTYIFPGLPPGPINLPEISSIDAVLNFEKHDYIYMCAKPEIGGYHNFSKTLKQHNSYARKYQRWVSEYF